MKLILGIFGEKFILKHFTRRNIPKRCVLRVFWTAQYVSEVYFTWKRLLFPFLIFFMGDAFGCFHILLTLKKKKIFFRSSTNFGNVVPNPNRTDVESCGHSFTSTFRNIPLLMYFLHQKFFNTTIFHRKYETKFLQRNSFTNKQRRNATVFLFLFFFCFLWLKSDF